MKGSAQPTVRRVGGARGLEARDASVMGSAQRSRYRVARPLLPRLAPAEQGPAFNGEHGGSSRLQSPDSVGRSAISSWASAGATIVLIVATNRIRTVSVVTMRSFAGGRPATAGTKRYSGLYRRWDGIDDESSLRDSTASLSSFGAVFGRRCELARPCGGRQRDEPLTEDCHTWREFRSPPDIRAPNGPASHASRWSGAGGPAVLARRHCFLRLFWCGRTSRPGCPVRAPKCAVPAPMLEETTMRGRHFERKALCGRRHCRARLER